MEGQRCYNWDSGWSTSLLSSHDWCTLPSILKDQSGHTLMNQVAMDQYASASVFCPTCHHQSAQMWITSIPAWLHLSDSQRWPCVIVRLLPVGLRRIHRHVWGEYTVCSQHLHTTEHLHLHLNLPPLHPLTLGLLFLWTLRIFAIQCRWKPKHMVWYFEPEGQLETKLSPGTPKETAF